MASGVESPKSVSAADAFVRRRLTEVCQRIRLHDVLAGGLRMGLTICGYLLGMSLFDLSTADLEQPWVIAVRWVGFVGFVVALVVLLVQLARAVLRPVNPYYAALRLEQTVPDAKNELINWLDLNDEKLPGTFLKNLNARAALQLEQSDPEETIDRRRHGLMLAVGAALLVGLLVLFARGPGQFLSLTQRALLPFANTQVAARSRITLVRPENGDARVAPNQAVPFSVRIEGLVSAVNTPGAPTLHYRYQAHEPFLTLPLHEDDHGVWHARLAADQVRTGFGYKISAGDAETPEYQVAVRGQPHAKQVEVTYRQRPARRVEDATTIFPNENAAVPHLVGQRGTTVEMVVRTNRSLKQAAVEVSTKQGRTLVVGQLVADDPQAYRCSWVLEKTGQFRIQFTSAEGEENVDRAPRGMDVLDDNAPRVTLTLPGKDVELPANGTLALAGLAEDDFGIKSLILRMRVVSIPADVMLEPKAYRPGQLKFADGSDPDAIEYKDFVALEQLKTERGAPFAMAAGMVVEYWLEAVDNSDYPSKAGNLGKSQTYKVNIVPPADDKEQQADRQNNAEAQQKHDKKQDDKQKEGKNQNGGAPAQPGGQGSDNKQNQATDDKVKQALHEQQKQQERGNAKEEPQPSVAKPGPDGSKDQPQPQPKEGKGEKNEKGDTKEKGKENAGASKDDGDMKEKKPGESEAKSAHKPQPQKGGGEAKDQGAESKEKQSGSAKGDDGKKKPGNEPTPQAKDNKAAPDTTPAQAKAEGAKTQEGKMPPGQAKGSEDAKTEAKASSPAPNGKNASPAQAKPGADMKPASVPEQGDAKPGPAAPADAPGIAKGDPPPDAKTRQPTWAEIEQLIDRMKEKKGLDETAKELADAGQKAADPKMREAAQEALSQTGRDPATGEANEPPGQRNSPPGTAQKNEPPPTAPEGTKPGTQGKPDTRPQASTTSITPVEANREFANRAGNLQLDDWRKHITPDILKTAGVTEAEWQRALKAADARNTPAMPQSSRPKRTDARAGGNVLPSRAPSAIGGLTPGRNDAVDAGRAEPPPELRDPQRRFSTRPTP